MAKIKFLKRNSWKLFLAHLTYMEHINAVCAMGISGQSCWSEL